MVFVIATLAQDFVAQIIASHLEILCVFPSQKMTSAFAAKAAARASALPRSAKVIGTHSGGFQADEALGCWLLRQLPDYAGSKIVRSRDPAELEPCDIVIDVGGIYDPDRLRFDHHQRGFFETADGERGKATRPEEATGRWKTKLSAAGLVYKHFGRAIIEQLAETKGQDTEVVWAEMYDRFMEGIDGNDNGVEVCEGPRRYKEGSDLSSHVGRLNPRWNEESDHADQCGRFERASSLCGEMFLSVLEDVVLGWLPARALVAKAVEARKEVHPSGEVIKLESGSMPWREHLYSLERAAGISGVVKFLLFIDSSGMHRIQAVTVEGTDFTNRLSLPEPWRGLRDQALSEASGIPGCKFCHATGFIGGNESYEGVVAMATKTLESAGASSGGGGYGGGAPPGGK